MWFVYILRCADNSYYTGITTDVNARIKKHNCGKGAKYTRARTPVKLVYLERKLSKQAAGKRENEIKALSRKDKIILVKRKESECQVYQSKTN